MIKKCLIAVVLFFSTMAVLFLNTNLMIRANINEGEGDQLLGKINYYKNIDLNNIQINVYRVNPLLSEKEEIVYYENNQIETIFPNANGEFFLKKPDYEYYLEVVDSTIPSGLGLVSLTSNDDNNNQFFLKEIERIDIKYEDYNFQIMLFDKDKTQLYANYSYDITSYSLMGNNLYIEFEITVNGKIYNKHFVQDLGVLSKIDKMNIFNLIEYSFEENNLKNTFASTQISHMNNNTGIAYEIKTPRLKTYFIEINGLLDEALSNFMLLDLKKQLETYIVSAEDFFYSKGYLMEQTSQFYAKIVLNVKETGQIANGITNLLENSDYNYMIELDYNSSYGSLTSLRAAIVHELFHTIIKGFTNDKIMTHTEAIDEGLATFIELYYMKIENQYLSQEDDSSNYELSRLHEMMYNYYENLMMNNQDQLQGQLEYGYKPIKYENSTHDYNYRYACFVAFMGAYLQCSEDNMFHEGIRFMLNYIKENVTYPYSYNAYLYMLNYLSIDLIELEETILLIPYHKNIVENIFSNDFINYESPYNIWKNKPLAAPFWNLKNVAFSHHSIINYFPQMESELDDNASVVIKFNSEKSIIVKIITYSGEQLIKTLGNSATIVISQKTLKNISMIQFINEQVNQKISIFKENNLMSKDILCDISETMNMENNNQFLFSVNEDGIYNFSMEIDGISQAFTSPTFDNIVVKDELTNCIIPNILSNKEFVDKVAVYLKPNRIYRLIFNYCFEDDTHFENESAKIVLRILSGLDLKKDNINEFYIEDFSLQSVKGVSLLSYGSYGRFTVSVSIDSPNIQNVDFSSFPVAICLQCDDSFSTVYTGIISKKSRSIITQLDVKKGDKIYCVYDSPNIDSNIYIESNRYERLDYNFSLIPDKNGVDEELLGSDVLINNAKREGKNITVGFTRCLFLTNNAPSLLRQDYYWASSDESIATVSEYGTIFARSCGIFTIYCISKKDYSIASSIVMEVIPDKNSAPIYLNYGMDCRNSGVKSGTEVTLGFGQIIPISNYTSDNLVRIKVGNNRLICLGKDSPTPYIQDFNWSIYGLNAENISISSFGTITAKKYTENGTNVVQIFGVYQYNTRYRVSIYIEIYQ